MLIREAHGKKLIYVKRLRSCTQTGWWVGHGGCLRGLSTTARGLWHRLCDESLPTSSPSIAFRMRLIGAAGWPSTCYQDALYLDTAQLSLMPSVCLVSCITLPQYIIIDTLYFIMQISLFRFQTYRVVHHYGRLAMSAFQERRWWCRMDISSIY